MSDRKKLIPDSVKSKLTLWLIAQVDEIKSGDKEYQAAKRAADLTINHVIRVKKMDEFAAMERTACDNVREQILLGLQGEAVVINGKDFPTIYNELASIVEKAGVVPSACIEAFASLKGAAALTR